MIGRVFQGTFIFACRMDRISGWLGLFLRRSCERLLRILGSSSRSFQKPLEFQWDSSSCTGTLLGRDAEPKLKSRTKSDWLVNANPGDSRLRGLLFLVVILASYAPRHILKTLCLEKRRLRCASRTLVFHVSTKPLRGSF